MYNVVVDSSSSTDLYQKLPSLPVVRGHCPHCAHLGHPMFSAFMYPVLSMFGGLRASRVCKNSLGHGLSFPVLSLVVTTEF